MGTPGDRDKSKPEGGRKGTPLLYYDGSAGAFVYSRGVPLRPPWRWGAGPYDGRSLDAY